MFIALIFDFACSLNTSTQFDQILYSNSLLVFSTNKKVNKKKRKLVIKKVDAGALQVKVAKLRKLIKSLI